MQCSTIKANLVAHAGILNNITALADNLLEYNYGVPNNNYLVAQNNNYV